jgi:hypothetical protein
MHAHARVHLRCGAADAADLPQACACALFPHPAAGTMNLPNYCCTGQCEVLASGNAAYNYRWINNNDVKYGGIRWTAYGNAADSSDEFQW